MTFGLFWKDQVLSKDSCGYCFGQLLDTFGLFFIPTSGHTGKGVIFLGHSLCDRVFFFHLCMNGIIKWRFLGAMKTRGLCILSLLLLLLLLSNDIKMMTEKKLKGLWLYFLEGKNFFAYYQCDQIWRNVNSIWTIFCMVHFIFGKLLKPTLTFLCYWANYHCCKWPKIK